MNEDVSNVEYLGEVRKSPAQVLKVSVGTYLGRAYVYTTIWTKDEQDPGMGEAPAADGIRTVSRSDSRRPRRR